MTGWSLTFMSLPPYARGVRAWRWQSPHLRQTRVRTRRWSLDLWRVRIIFVLDTQEVLG